jgi:hypothetical protein
MGKRRRKDNQGFVLIDESMQVAEGHLPLVINQKEHILQRYRDTLPFLDLGIEMAVVTGGDIPDVARSAIHLALMDRIGRAI